MNRVFTWVAVALSLLLALIQLAFTQTGNADSLPLLTRLFMNEFGLFIALAGAVSGVLRIQKEGFNIILATGVAICIVFAAGFGWVGYQYWPTIQTG